MAALALSRKLASSTPVLNFLGAEISMLLESMCVEELIPGHLYGAANKQTDALSRLAAPKCALLPPEVIAAKNRASAVRYKGYYKLPTPTRVSSSNEAEDISAALTSSVFACPWSSMWAFGGSCAFHCEPGIECHPSLTLPGCLWWHLSLPLSG